MGLSDNLISQFAKLTVGDKKTRSESTVFGTVREQDGSKYVMIDGSELLTPVSSTTDIIDGDRVTVLIKDHTATITGNLSSPSARLEHVKEVEGVVANVDTLVAEEVKAQTGEFDKVIAGLVEAEVGKFDTIIADKVDAEIVDAKLITTDYLTTNYLDAKTINAKFAEIGTLDVDTLNANYAQIDFANIGEAAIKKLFSDSGLIKDLIVSDGRITGELDAVTINGDLINANTLKADRLVVKGKDGLYYQLNVNGVGENDTPEYETDENGDYILDENGNKKEKVDLEGNRVYATQTDENSLNGTKILAKSITASKIAVDDLVAFDATIGGFQIDDDSIHSHGKGTIYQTDENGEYILDDETGEKIVKTSGVHNTNPGIYMDDIGQVAFGDADNYVKYYKDENDQWKMAFKASEFDFDVSPGVSIGEAIGNTIILTEEEFYLSTSPTELAGDEWSTSQPTWTEGKYIWRRTKNTYNKKDENDNPVVDYTPSENGVCITGNTGAQGPQGETGEPYTVTLTNDNHTFTGDTEAAIGTKITCNVEAYKGSTRIPTKITKISGVPYKDGSSVTVYKGLSCMPGNNDGKSTENYLFIMVSNSSDNRLTTKQGTFSIEIEADGVTFERSFSFSVALKGADGAPGDPGPASTVYSMGLSTNVIKRTSTGTFNPMSITLTGRSQTGDDSVSDYAGRLVIESTNSDTIIPSTPWTEVYVSKSNESTTTKYVGSFTNSSTITALRCSLYKADNSEEWTTTDGILLDQQIVPIVSDGTPGDPGDDAYTVILSNENHTFSGDTTAAIKSSLDCYVEVYKGSTKLGTKITKIGNTNINTNVTSATPYAGLKFTVNNNGGSSTENYVTIEASPTGSSLTTESGSVTLTIQADGQTFTKDFSFSVAFQGQQGETGPQGPSGDPGTTYSMIANLYTILKTASGKYIPESITLYGRSQSGVDSVKEHKCWFKITPTLSSGTPNVYTSNSEEASVNYTIPENLTSLRCAMYLDAELRTMLDEITIPVVSDGKKGDNGNDAYTIVLSNDNHTFAGSTAAALPGETFCKVFAYKGIASQKVTIGTFENVPAGMTVTIVSGTNGTTAPEFKIEVTSSMTTASGSITVPVTVDGNTFNKDFSYSIAFEGAKGDPGDSATTYTLLPSVNAIVKGQQGSYSPSSLILNAKYQVGNGALTDYNSALFKVEQSEDMINWESPVSSSTAGKTYTISTIPAGIKGLRCSMYKTSIADANLLDQQVIPIVSDGTDGDGKDAYTVILSNENHTFAGADGKAINTSFNNYVEVYKGSTKLKTKITKINTTSITGNTYTTAIKGFKFTTYNNSGTSTSNYVTIEASPSGYAALTNTSGIVTFTIVTEDNQTFTKDFSYSIVFKGDKGDPGVSIKSVAEKYGTSTDSNVEPTQWYDYVPDLNATDKYLWNYEIITYSDDTTANPHKHETDPAIIGVFGEDGGKGDPGRGIVSVTNWYLATSTPSGVTTSTSGWSKDVQSVSSDKKYLWNYEVIEYDSGTPKTVSTDPLIIGAYGDKGDPGDSATVYSMILSSSVIASNSSGAFTPASITLSGNSKTGAGATTAYAGCFKIETTTNGSTWISSSTTGYAYSSSSNESTKTFTIPASVKAIRCSMYSAGGFSTLLDQQVVPVVYDGTDGDPGAPAYTVVLSNENHTFGGTESAAVGDTLYCYVEVYKGATKQKTKITKIGSTSITTTGQSVIPYTGLKFTPYNNDGSSTSNYVYIEATSSLTTASGSVTLTIQADGQTFTKDFSFSVAFKGAKGEAADTYSILLNSNVIRSESGSYNPTSLTLTGKKQSATGTLSNYSGYFKVETSTDMSNWTSYDTKTTASTTHSCAVPTNITGLKGLRCSMYSSSTLSDSYLLDRQTVPIVTGGGDGKDAYTVILSNENHTFAGTKTAAIGSNFSFYIEAYEGATQIPTKVTKIGSTSITTTGQSVTPVTGLTFTPYNNGTTSNFIYVQATNSLTMASGSVAIEIEADGNKFVRDFSFSVAFAGEDGDPGADAYTVILSNENHTFAGTTSAAIGNDILYCYVKAYKGAEQRPTKITKVGDTDVTSSTGWIYPYTGLGVYVISNNTTSNYIYVTTTNSLTTTSGAVTLTIEVDGITFTRDFSFSLALQGDPGKDGQAMYGVCGTDASTAAKVVTLSTGSLTSLYTGATVTVKFSDENTTAAPTLNVNNTDAKTIKMNTVVASSTNPCYWPKNIVLTFVYDGTNWVATDTSSTHVKPAGSGLIVGNYYGDTLQSNVHIGASEIDIRYGNTIYASYGANTIYLGKNNPTSKIDLCNGTATMQLNGVGTSNEYFNINVPAGDAFLSSSHAVSIDAYHSTDADWTQSYVTAFGYGASPYISMQARYHEKSTTSYPGGYDHMSEIKLLADSGSATTIELYAMRKDNTIKVTLDPYYTLMEGVTVPTMSVDGYVSCLGLMTNYLVLNNDLTIGGGLSVGKQISVGTNIQLGNKQYIYGKANANTSTLLKMMSMGYVTSSNTNIDTLFVGQDAYDDTTKTDGPDRIYLGVNGYTLKFYKSGSTTIPYYFHPATKGQCSCGTDSFPWYRLYAQNTSIGSSDRRMKENIIEFGVNPTTTYSLRGSVDIHSELFDRLKPVQYNFIEGNPRTCYGLIAQDVIEAMAEIGIGENDLDLVHHGHHVDPETGEETDTFGIAYTNLIAMLIHEVQKLKSRVDKLENS